MSGNNSTKDYNDSIRANLPTGMVYNNDRYQVNNHSFFKFKKAGWYYNYVTKYGYSAIPPYAIGGFDPALVFDFPEEFYRTGGSTTTFSNALTHSRLGNATMHDSDGLLKWAPHNLALNSAAPVTQSLTVVSGVDYTVECAGSGSVVLSGAGSGTVTGGSPVEITASTTTLTLTVSGSVDLMWAYRSDLGGMVNNPDTGNSYVPTTSTAVYMPRRNAYVYDGSSWVNAGVQIESAAATNLVLNSDNIEAQTVSVTPGSTYTVSFDRAAAVAELSESIAKTAVDVFVYDTSKDSDGGAWRTGTLAQASSWYNETLNTATRGSRQEFPEVAVIVAESNKITIYDGDDATLPMWHVEDYTSLTIRAAVAINGQIWIGTSTGVIASDYAGDDLGTTTLDYTTSTTPAIVNNSVNDCAATVLSDAPTDPATGLPVPTIAVATDGGVSVIKDDGTVVDITHTDGNEAEVVMFSDDQKLVVQPFSRAWGYRVYSIPTTDVSNGVIYSEGSELEWYHGGWTQTIAARKPDLWLSLTGSTSYTALAHSVSGAALFSGDVSGLSQVARDANAPSKGMVAYTTSTYNTG